MEAAEAKEKRGIMQPVPVSDALRRLAGGAPEISRVGAIKFIWAHIRANGLQNPANKREINCDEKLKSLFAGRDKVGMMEKTCIKVHFYGSEDAAVLHIKACNGHERKGDVYFLRSHWKFWNVLDIEFA